MQLSEIIIAKIKQEGPVSFRDFMEMALYYPGTGYYTSEGDKLGETGDFYTSPCYTSLFGQMIARQLEEMWRLLGETTFTIVEYGAGTGILCRDILEAVQTNGAFYNKINYCIIEKSIAMRKEQEKILSDRVNWYNTIHDIPTFSGCILSNEVVDNFSVHQVFMQKELMEICVDYNEGFTEQLRPASTEIKDYLSQLNVTLPEGFRTEINLEAVQWISELPKNMEKGFVLTIDYGYPSSQLYDNSRKQGTLVCYHKHQVNYCPYQNIGAQDITTHINFSALHHWGSKSGLSLAGFTNQSYFLMGLGLSSCADNNKKITATGLRHFLVNMGTKFKILAQQKGVNNMNLSGFRFCQPLI